MSSAFERGLSQGYEQACRDVIEHINRRDPRLPPDDVDDDAEDAKPPRQCAEDTDQPVPPPGGPSGPGRAA